MKFLLICDFREGLKNYASFTETNLYNDHPSTKNICEIIDSIKSLGYECEYFGGIPELIHAIENKQQFNDCIFLNFTDGMDEKYSRVQAPALLDILNVPYSGSGVFASVLMNNKHFETGMRTKIWTIIGLRKEPFYVFKTTKRDSFKAISSNTICI